MLLGLKPGENCWTTSSPFGGADRGRTLRRLAAKSQMSNDLHLEEDAGKGLILNVRLLWTFSAAYRYTNHTVDRSLAQAAYEYLTGRFFDVRHGGYFWELDPQGHVVDDHKKTYGQAFVVYCAGRVLPRLR